MKTGTDMTNHTATSTKQGHLGKRAHVTGFRYLR